MCCFFFTYERRKTYLVLGVYVDNHSVEKVFFNKIKAKNKERAKILFKGLEHTDGETRLRELHVHEWKYIKTHEI